MITIIQGLALIGLILSCYAYGVEKRLKKRKTHKALCDINKKITCTKVFASSYGHLLGVSNALLGVVFYLIILLLEASQYPQYVWYLSLIAGIGTIYLIYLMYAKLKKFCVVCHAIYLVNILLVIASYLQL